MNFLGFSWSMIYHQILSQVEPRDFMIGLSKGLIFGVIVGAIGCLRGLQTKEGPQAVGVSATRAVVSGILLIIFANTLYSAVQYFFQRSG
jgi:phospholipid/cholesterol/gamma-HCH transport system permease protein